MQCSTKTCAHTVHNSAQLRCFENGNDDFGIEAFWIGDAARVGYFVPLNGPLNGHPPSSILIMSSESAKDFGGGALLKDLYNLNCLAPKQADWFPHLYGGMEMIRQGLTKQ